MAILKISADNGTTYTDYSNFVSKLQITYNVNRTEKMNAAGNTVVDISSRKRTISVAFRPLMGADATTLIATLDSFILKLSYFDAKTNTLVEGVNCKVDGAPSPEYYCINGKTIINSMEISFVEL